MKKQKKQEAIGTQNTEPVLQKKEVYKGIEFIRISKLPAAQQQQLMSWITQDKIMKILREDEILLRDCVQYRHYQEWFIYYAKPLQDQEVQAVTLPRTPPVRQPAIPSAFNRNRITALAILRHLTWRDQVFDMLKNTAKNFL